MKILSHQRIHVTLEGSSAEMNDVHNWIRQLSDRGIETLSLFQGPKMRDFPYTEPDRFIKVVDVVVGEDVQLPIARGPGQGDQRPMKGDVFI